MDMPQSTPIDPILRNRVVWLLNQGADHPAILGELARDPYGSGPWEARTVIAALDALESPEHDRMRESRRPRHYAPPGPRPTGPPEQPTDLEGFRVVLGLASWELRQNTTARRPEARPEDGEWEPCEGLVRDRMMTACERAAITREGWRTEGWQIRGVRRETRLINVLASERPEAGEGTAEYRAALEWLATPRPRHLKQEDVYRGAGLLQKYESPARAPKHVQADVRQALLDSGWRERSVRLPGGPRKRWCAPASVVTLARVSLRPSSFAG